MLNAERQTLALRPYGPKSSVSFVARNRFFQNGVHESSADTDLDLFVDKSERRFPGHRIIGSRGASSGISATSGGNRSRNCLSSDSANYVRPKLKRERNISTGMKVKIRFRGDGFSGHHKS